MKTKFFPSFFLMVLLVAAIPLHAHKAYNEAINKAELAITAGQFKAAEDSYRIAFGLQPTPHVGDLQNALLVAIENKNPGLAFDYGERLAMLGVGQAYFKRTAFSWLATQAGWAVFLNRAEQLRQEGKEKHSALFDEVMVLVHRQLNTMAASWADARPGEDELKNLHREKRDVEMRLLEIFKREGYLSAYKIGVWMEDDTLIAEPIFTEIIRWQYMTNLSTHETANLADPYDSFANIMWAAEASGLVDFAYLEGALRSSALSDLGFHDICRNTCKLFIGYNTGTLRRAQIGLARSRMGLDTYPEYIQKLRYNVTHPGNSFVIYPDVLPFLNSNCPHNNPGSLNFYEEVMEIPGCKQ